MTPSVTSITTTLRRQRGMTPEAAAAAVDQACRRLRLPTIRAVVEEATTAAEREQLTYQGFLAELLLAECDDRDRRSTIRRGDPLCLIGDSGTGKSHLVIGLGTAADEKQLARTIARYGHVDLRCIDELGCMELDRRGAELLFQVLTEREEEASVAIAD